MHLYFVLICGPVGRHQNFPDFCIFELHCLRRSVVVFSCDVHIFFGVACGFRGQVPF